MVGLIIVAISPHFNKGNQRIPGALHAMARKTPASKAITGSTPSHRADNLTARSDILGSRVTSDTVASRNKVERYTSPARATSGGVGTLRSLHR